MGRAGFEPATVGTDAGTLRVPAWLSTQEDGPGRIRTCDLGIKSPLLCQLSYRPTVPLQRTERGRGSAGF
jgi:hypothetical protein